MFSTYRESERVVAGFVPAYRSFYRFFWEAGRLVGLCVGLFFCGGRDGSKHTEPYESPKDQLCTVG